MDGFKTDGPGGLSNMNKVDKTPEASPSTTTPGTSDTATPSAIIGAKIRIKGELVGEEDLTIQGYVEGTIDLKNNNLTVGKDGKLKADVSAKTIIIEGDVEGDLFGEERIVIRESSNVRGSLVADRVSLEDGAKFRGSIDMDISARKAEMQKNQSDAVDGPAVSGGNAKPAGVSASAGGSSDNKDKNALKNIPKMKAKS
jgi:cytoskeletal protein CcmA (bactofilin family)